MKFVYPAVFKKKEDGMIHVTFPDLEGCYAEGPTMEDALEKAKEAEIDWIALELEESFDLPARSREVVYDLLFVGALQRVIGKRTGNLLCL